MDGAELRKHGRLDSHGVGYSIGYRDVALINEANNIIAPALGVSQIAAYINIIIRPLDNASADCHAAVHYAFDPDIVFDKQSAICRQRVIAAHKRLIANIIAVNGAVPVPPFIPAPAPSPAAAIAVAAVHAIK